MNAGGGALGLLKRGQQTKDNDNFVVTQGSKVKAAAFCAAFQTSLRTSVPEYALA